MSSGPSRRAPGRQSVTSPDRNSTRLNSSHGYISYAVFCLKKKKKDAFSADPNRDALGSIIAPTARRKHLGREPKARIIFALDRNLCVVVLRVGEALDAC